MSDPKQAGGASEPDAMTPPGAPPAEVGPAEVVPADVVPAEVVPAVPDNRLVFWLSATAALGAGSLLLRQPELGAFGALAGLFAVAHAADLDPGRRLLYRALAWIVPVAGVLSIAGFTGVLLAQWMSDGLRRMTPLEVAALLSGAAGVALTAAMALPPVAAACGRVLFRTPATSHVLRLATRLAAITLLLYLPSHLAFPALLETLTDSGASLLGPGSLWGNLIGLSWLALGGVGLQIRRGWREACDRLGLHGLRPVHGLWIVGGVIALILLNTGAEWAQKRWFPDLWAADQRVGELIAGSLGRSGALLLGLSAGLGEELVLRGALQPRLGVWRTAAVFAALHVQYSWVGALVIFVLGILLGEVRRRTSTTVAILVHAVYDVIAVLTLAP